MDAPITWLIDRLNQQHLYAAICNLRLHDDHNDEILSSFLNYPVLSLRDASLYSKIHQQEIIKNIRFESFFVPSQFSLRIKNSRNASLSKRDIGNVITSTSCKYIIEQPFKNMRITRDWKRSLSRSWERIVRKVRTESSKRFSPPR